MIKVQILQKIIKIKSTEKLEELADTMGILFGLAEVHGYSEEDLERDMAKESEKFDDSYDEILFQIDMELNIND